MPVAVNTSFCGQCGDYIAPEQAVIAWTAPGKAETVCPDCRRSIYQTRIVEAIQSLNMKPRRSELPLFA